MNIAGKLRELRDKKGLTQRDLAKIIGITEETLMEKYPHIISLMIIEKKRSIWLMML